MGSGKVTFADVKKTLTEKGCVAVYEEKPDYLVILKGPGIPSAPLASGALSAYEIIAETYPEISCIKGKNSLEGGLIHRIDTDTAGLLLVARTQHFYDETIAAQKNGAFVKYYTAYCSRETIPNEGNSGAPLLREDVFPQEIRSRFRPFGEKGAMVKPVFEMGAGRADRKKAGAAVYTTNVLTAEQVTGGNVLCVTCAIEAGFRHQVRSHLSSSGYPVIGDVLYGSKTHAVSRMLFFASGIELKHTDINIRLPESVFDEIAAETI